MFEFWAHAAALPWLIVAFIIGWIVLLVLAGLLAHEIFFVLLPRLINTNKENKENPS